jgi:hypothetical protein
MRAEDAARDELIEARIELEKGGSPLARERQLELYRHMTPGEKLALTLELTGMADTFNRARLRLLHPEADEREITLLLAERKHGRETAAKLRTMDARELAQRERSTPDSCSQRGSE